MSKREQAREVANEFNRVAEVTRLTQLAKEGANVAQAGNIDYSVGAILLSLGVDDLLMTMMTDPNDTGISRREEHLFRQIEKLRAEHNIPRGVEPEQGIQRTIVRVDFLTRKSIAQAKLLKRVE